MDFAGINAKIDRASNAIGALSSEIDELCTNIRQGIVHEIDGDAGEQRWDYRDRAPEVPIEWSIRAGEILYNLRSALDHLVWQLVLANGNEPTISNQFPIVDQEEAWNSRSANNLRGVADENKKIIRHLQPFNPSLQLPVNGGYQPCNAQVFRTLRELCNVDKHRYLNLIMVRARGIEPIVFGENQPSRRLSSKQLEGRGIRGEIETEMTLLTINDMEQELKPNFIIGVNFHCLQPNVLTRTSATEQLRDCLEAVQGSCRLFRRQ